MNSLFLMVTKQKERFLYKISFRVILDYVYNEFVSKVLFDKTNIFELMDLFF